MTDYQDLKKRIGNGLKKAARVGGRIASGLALIASPVVFSGCSGEPKGLTREDFDRSMCLVEELGCIKDLNRDGSFDGITGDYESSILSVVTEDYFQSDDFNEYYTTHDLIVLDQEGTKELNDLVRNIGDFRFKLYRIRTAEAQRDSTQ